jgi:hypothetical protein
MQSLAEAFATICRTHELPIAALEMVIGLQTLRLDIQKGFTVADVD